MSINYISLIFLFLIPQALVCTAAVIFLQRVRSAGAIFLLVGVIISLTSFAPASLFPLQRHETGYILMRMGFLYAGAYLNAIGLLMIALKVRKVAQSARRD